MSHSPFDMFMVKNIIITPWFAINSIHFCFFFMFIFILCIGLIFRYTKNNLVHNLIFNIWDMINSTLNGEERTHNKEDLIVINPRSWFFFAIFLLMLVGNIASRLPGINPSFSLLIVSIPLHLIIILYFLYFAISIHKTKVLTIFFNPHILLPIRIFIGLIEIISLFVKVFSFSVRLLANITAGHILMWVIEMFVQNMPMYGKPLPFVFLVGMYMMELIIGVLQSYIFLVLSVTIFKSLEEIHH